tara:strand:+ start:202 stop:900 length:699 start_codon:yes stop_codon:yes gene_type:complete
MRLNKFLSERGPYSRRAVDKLIKDNRITINGKKVRLGQKVSIDDEIKVDGQIINKPKKRKKLIYLMLNKPIGIECTTDTNTKNNIIDFIGYPKRIFPVGRLDKDSEGLILLTNDGDIVNKILRSENNNEKEYEVQVNKKITADFLNKMRSGVKLRSATTKKCKIEKLNNYSFKIILTQGLNRQIRKMCLQYDYRVKFLKRIRIINVSLGKLRLGKFRKLTQIELDGLSRKIN